MTEKLKITIFLISSLAFCFVFFTGSHLNLIFAQTDTTPPAAITNLSTSDITSSSVTLNWTAPGDDANSGTSTSYDIRYSTSNINELNWTNAKIVSSEPKPQVAGTSQSFTVTNLQPYTTYYFAIKAKDEKGNISNLSNIPSATTQSLTVSVALMANPNSGFAPLKDVDLTATLSGSTKGYINYTFYCNRSDSGINVTTPYDVKYDNTSLTTRTAKDICDYNSSGTYTAKVIAERGNVQAENRVIITVTASTTPPKPPLTPQPTSVLSGPFVIGMYSNQVKILQQMLANDKEVYPEGEITGYYGSLTIKAVQRFQCKYNLICYGTPEINGFGLAGPATRTKLNELYGSTFQDKQLMLEKLKEQIRILQQKLIQLLMQLTVLLQKQSGTPQ